MKLTRRDFLKSAAVTALAVSMSGMLTSCDDGELVGAATGLNKTAELSNIRMTVRELGVVAETGSKTCYLVPKLVIRNEGALAVAVDPAKGSFKVVVDGKTDLTVDASTMKKVTDSSKLTPVLSQSLKHGNQASGSICAMGKDLVDWKYADVIFYPSIDDKKTYLRCRIYKNDAYPMLGI